MKALPRGVLRHLDRKIHGLMILVSVLFLAVWASVSADTIVRSFSSQKSIEAGYVVAISQTDTNQVEPAPAKDLSRIYGVVVEPGSAPVTLERPSANIFVATAGNYPLLVTTQNGPVNSGDYLSLSRTDGLATRATNRQDYIVGKALENFDGSNPKFSTDKSGAAGLIKAQINPGKNPLAKDNPAVPGLLLSLATSLAGKPVSTARVYSSLATFVLTVLISASLVWVAVRTSLISIGRNPLSQHSILRGLFQVILMSVLVFGGGLAGTYLLLKI